MSPKYRDEVNKLLAGLDDDEKTQKRGDSDIPPTPGIKREIHYIFVRETDDDTEDHVVDSEVSNLDTAPLQPKQSNPRPAPITYALVGTLLLGMFIPLLCLAVQINLIVNPYTVTVTLLAKSQQISLNGTLQLGRMISPVTLSQSQTVPASGRGHQDAARATGFITFYNGFPAQQFVAAGAILTSASGMQIVTTQDAAIPAADLTAHPPVFGQVTVTAQAVLPGSKSNIAAYDINQTCCATSVVAQNLKSFSGGQDARDFQTVTRNDLAQAATPLKSTVNQSMQSTLTGQLKNGEVLTSQICSTTQIADHQIGQEASFVKVTVTESCSAYAYNSQMLTSRVTQLLTSQATRKLGTGYRMLVAPQVNIIQARAQGKTVILTFNAQSAWGYGLSTKEQQAIKKLIAGKNTDTALQLLYSLPDVERVSLTTSGFGDGSRIPKTISCIILALYYGL